MLQPIIAEHGYPKHLPPKTNNRRRLKMNTGWVCLQFHLRPDPCPCPRPQRNSASSRKKNDVSRWQRAKGVNKLSNNKKRRNKKPRHGEKGSSRKKESNATKTSVKKKRRKRKLSKRQLLSH
ncbi:Angiogenic factor with G-patch and FHA domains 1 [Balamuthia mandrillaris]